MTHELHSDYLFQPPAYGLIGPRISSDGAKHAYVLYQVGLGGSRHMLAETAHLPPQEARRLAGTLRAALAAVLASEAILEVTESLPTILERYGMPKRAHDLAHANGLLRQALAMIGVE